MAKKKIILSLSLIFLWLLIIGRGGDSAFFGSINLIDEGQYLAWIQQIMNGKVIYKDIYVQYGPLMVMPPYLLMKFFGSSFFILRLWETIDAFIAFIIAIIVLSKLKVNKYLKLLSLISLLVIPGLSLRAWIGVLAIFTLLLAYRKDSRFMFILAGALSGSIIFYSVDIGMFLFLTVFAYLISRLITKKNILKELKVISIFSLGVVLSVALLSLFFSYLGWMGNYIQTTIDFIGSIAGNNLPNGMGLPKPLSIFSIDTFFGLLKALSSKEMLFYYSFFILLFIFLLNITRHLLIDKKNRNVLPILLSVYSLLLFISIIGRSGHYLVIVPFVIILSAYTISQILTAKKMAFSNAAKIFFVALFVIYIFRHIAIFRFNLIPDISHVSTMKIDRIYPFFTTMAQAGDIKILNDFFGKLSMNKNTVYILSNAPGLYFILDLNNPTRYDLPLLAETIGMRYEIVNQLKENRPIFIIEDKNAWAVDGVSDRQRMPEVFNYVVQNYKFKTNVGRYIIYSLKPIYNKS